ncbi:MAG: hypothetical protein ED556_12195 [Winogradskyella sp.]|uniref:hypothetical protein n=1 Tax=Winogradskyella sp. TaxID=1883156 RepID=UPI000F3D31D3|nr:hypothetical protein [Winogradskyella sp.]RNC84209.1 MAG: hypothetical protein ED556_12195 [Winogradskyella sp.]
MNYSKTFSNPGILFIVLITVLSIHSCDDVESIGVTPDPVFVSNVDLETFSDNFGSDIQRDFLGTIVDTNNNPIAGVSVSVGGSNATTDNNGVFIIRDANVQSRFAYVKAERAGYLNASRSLVPTTGTNKVFIMMLPENNVGTVSSGTQETVSLSNGTSVTLNGNYVNENGETYSGNVSVIMHYLNPDDENMTQQMPGMLYAANADNEERILQTFGMLAIELRGDSGEDLNLANGSAAEISAPVPQSLLNDAPATIPLWSFNEEFGVWVEEGTATLDNGNYVGTVTHFSFWNFDIPFDGTNLCITFVDEDTNPLSNLNIRITSQTIGSGGGFTNEDGEACGPVPIGETLELVVSIVDACGINEIFTSTIGPFNSDSNLEIIIPNSALVDLTIETVKGRFANCNQEPVTDGYVKLSYGSIEVADMVTNSDLGNFEINFVRCNESNEFTLTGVDFTTSQSSDIIAYNFSTPLTDVGSIAACNDYAYNYITFQVGNYPPIQQIEAPFPISLNTDNNFGCSDGDIFGAGFFILSFSPFEMHLDINNFNGVGTYNGDDGMGDFNSSDSFAQLRITNMIQLGNGISQSRGLNFVGTAEVLTFGEVGEIVEILVTGTIDVFEAMPGIGNDILVEDNVPITGFMHLVRDN